MKTTATHVAAAAKTTMLNFVVASISLVTYFFGIAAFERNADKVSVLLWLAGASLVAAFVALAVFLIASKKEASTVTLALSK